MRRAEAVNERGALSCSWVRRLSVVEFTIPPKLSFKADPIALKSH